VQANVNWLWTLAQPALFALLGASVKLDAIKVDELASGLFIIAVALSIRIAVTRVAMFGSMLNSKECLLVCIAWLPKATVQAAVGGTALELAVELNLGPEQVARAELVLMLSVLVILLTAPIGAIGIAVAGPKYLTLDKADDISTLPTKSTGLAAHDSNAAESKAQAPAQATEK